MLIPVSSNEIISSGVTPTFWPYRTSFSTACSNRRAPLSSKSSWACSGDCACNCAAERARAEGRDDSGGRGRGKGRAPEAGRRRAPPPASPTLCPPCPASRSGDACDAASITSIPVMPWRSSPWLTVRAQIRTGITALLTGYAYETIPNKSIIAGKTHGADDAEQPAPASLTIPAEKPATLCWLALGAPGLSIWKREGSPEAAQPVVWLASPAPDGVLRFVSDAAGGKVSATRQAIHQQWSELQKQIHEPGKMHKLMANGVVYVGSDNGKVYAFDLKEGQK